MPTWYYCSDEHRLSEHSDTSFLKTSMFEVFAENISVRMNGKTILNDISFTLPEGKSMAITGPSGSGKTTLGRLISGGILPNSGVLKISEGKRCLMVEQQDNFIAVSHMRSGYYGQRYENLGMEDVPTVGGFLLAMAQSIKREIGQAEIESGLKQMDMLQLINRKLMLLSNGERKRVQLAAALLQQPDILILDQPFIGLDILARKILEQAIIQLINSGKTIVLICDSEHIPDRIDLVLEMNQGRIHQFVERKKYAFAETENTKPEPNSRFIQELHPAVDDHFGLAVKMTNVRVSLAGNEILKNIDWTVRKGERWAVMGPNGAGKTTLLSLINADNPQGYVNDLVLFDRKRGSGESIWDIKKRIGFVSPELHLFFLRGKGIFNSIPGLDSTAGFKGNSISCIDVITSGFHDLVGISEYKSEMHQKAARQWLDILNMNHLADRLFHEASLSEQRLLLLARALVKMPSLLILDEPCQGLDPHQTKLFTHMLDQLCSQIETTLIYVTHYPEEIPRCVEYLLQLEHGEVKSCGKFQPH